MTGAGREWTVAMISARLLDGLLRFCWWASSRSRVGAGVTQLDLECSARCGTIAMTVWESVRSRQAVSRRAVVSR
jgi:hypothetical protein